MRARFVRVVADDLTGALDSAAPFASPERPMRILLDSDSPLSSAAGELAGVGISSESRNVDWPVAERRITQALRRLDVLVPAGAAPLNFAKVDSVLRGAPIAETRLRCALWQANGCLFAPAFVEMGRRTLGGRHQVRIDDEWRDAYVGDLVAAFDEIGIRVRVRRSDDDWPLPTTGFVVGDAVEVHDLRQHVAAGPGQTTGAAYVWAGSRGLAEAIAGGSPHRPMPAIKTVVNGTTHPNTVRQLGVADRAGQWQSVQLIDATREARSAADTGAAVRAVGQRLSPDGPALFVIGGDTLSTLLGGAETRSLACIGEVASGIPISRIEGGRLDGVTLVSKSGGFGEPDLFVRLLDARIR